ncbi:hypothetical protein ACFYM2_19510 [Streptomyces sp. NPDC006711]|uniref:hypothetical protein n=1 Tax=unclassified Streptomyces TaxID=2593676 RepID=UPI0033EFF035
MGRAPALNAYSLVPFLLITVPLVCVLAGFGVIGWDVVLGVAGAVGVLAVVVRAGSKARPR